jgi:hypothetical protein
MNWSDAGNDRTSQPFVLIAVSIERSAQVTGVPGGAVIWNFIVPVVPPPVVSYVTHSIPVVGSVAMTHATHEKKVTSDNTAMVQIVRCDDVPP